MDKKYSKNINYDGKWVLYKNYYTDNEYTSIYVYSIREDIVCYRYESETNGENRHYMNLNNFENCDEFFINPIQNSEHVKINIPRISDPYDWSCDYDGGVVNTPPHYGSDAVSYCPHEWFYFNYLTLPPIHARECKKCGKKEIFKGGEWITE